MGAVADEWEAMPVVKAVVRYEWERGAEVEKVGDNERGKLPVGETVGGVTGTLGRWWVCFETKSEVDPTSSGMTKEGTRDYSGPFGTLAGHATQRKEGIALQPEDRTKQGGGGAMGMACDPHRFRLGEFSIFSLRYETLGTEAG